MGFDAFVKCNCYEEGKTSQPPCSKELIEMDKLYGLSINISYDNYPQKVIEFDKWIHNAACQHQDMEVCSEHLANISGMTAFRTVISELGEDKYPILSGNLPKVNGGYLPIELVDSFEYELYNIMQEYTSENIVVLMETTHNNRTHSTNLNYNKVFAFEGKKNLTYTLSKDGVKIIKDKRLLGFEFKNTVFHSKKFTQEKVGNGKYLLTDLKTKATFESGIILYADNEIERKQLEYEVIEKQALISEEYEYIITPLLKLIKASRETGNPIVWC